MIYYWQLSITTYIAVYFIDYAILKYEYLLQIDIFSNHTTWTYW